MTYTPFPVDVQASTATGGALYSVGVLLPYPVEDIEWNPTTQPAPFAAAGLAGQYVLLTDQDAFSSGIYQFTDDPVTEPLVFVKDPCDTATHGYTYATRRIAIGGIAQSNYSDVVCAVDPNTGAMFYAGVGASSPVIFTAYTTSLDVTEPPTTSDGETPLASLAGGIPLPVLLTAQSDPTENGFYFATMTRATRSRLRDRPTSLSDPVATVLGLDGDVAASGDWLLATGSTYVPTGLSASVENLTVRLNRYYPASPVTPHLMRSKYVTVDPDFPLDGSATHVGGQSIDSGQNITITSNASGNGGVWTLSLTGPAVRAQGFGSLVDTDIGNYDLISFTGTRWGYESVWRLYGNATTKGLTLVTGAEAVSRSYRPDLIATDDSPFVVAEADGTTTTITPNGTTMPGTLAVLLLPSGGSPEMRTYVDGVLEMTEDFSAALGMWIARGVDGVGKGAVATTDGDGSGVLLT